ncbi:MAG: hypothetical protein QM657_09565 [Lacrimispora sp.]|uniref:hypothetical protein n=1 Tax=Lacrimispora sp. TaxID=2719234 RepID=UPI0039E2CF0E
MEDSILIEILKEVQKRYNCIVEIERITRDMGDSLSRNDRESVQLLLGMRQEEMDKADLCTRNMEYLVSALPPEEGFKVRGWMKGNANITPDTPAAAMLLEKGKNIHSALKRTIELDRYISIRLSGKDSYYQ